MAEITPTEWRSIRQSAGPYPPEAYDFVREGLGHTVKMVFGEDAASTLPQEGENRHVTGQQLCLGLRDFAIRKYGRLARTVLSHWHVNCTDDFGKIVYAMIDAGLMSRSESDDFGDFGEVYDFEEAFPPPSLN